MMDRTQGGRKKRGVVGGGERLVQKDCTGMVGGWVGALKLRLKCPLLSPACDLRAPDSQESAEACRCNAAAATHI